MKCEDFTSKFESGTAVERLQASLHARRCPKCSAARQRMCDLRRELAAPAELTAYHRRVWEQAAVDQAPEPVWRWLAQPRWAAAGGLAIAATVIVAIVLSMPKPDDSADQQVAVKPPSPPSNVVTVPLRMPPEEMVALESGLDQVAADLDRLAEEAARLEARRAISELAASYPPLGANDST